MANLRARIDKLHDGLISKVTSRVIVTKDDKVIKQKVFGNNMNKVVTIVVRL